MVVDTTLYDHLSIAYDASVDDIKKSYKKAALKWHPDRNKDNPAAAEEKFKECSQAYEILSDPQKRAIYDDAGLEGVLGGTGINSQSVYTTSTYNQSMRNPDADNLRESRQRQRRAGSSSFRFQASWSFGFGGGSNRGTYHGSWSTDSANFRGGGGTIGPNGITNLFDSLQQEMFSRTSFLRDGGDSVLRNEQNNDGSRRRRTRQP